MDMVLFLVVVVMGNVHVFVCFVQFIFVVNYSNLLCICCFRRRRPEVKKETVVPEPPSVAQLGMEGNEMFALLKCYILISKYALQNIK